MSKEILTMDDQVGISPEILEIANTYLMHGMDTARTAVALGLPAELVNSTINGNVVGRYITAIMLEQGYMNRNKIYQTMSTILEKKLEECVEADMYSSKDILDILKMMNDMRVKEEEMILKRMEIEAKLASTKVKVGTVVNVNTPAESNLGNLLANILKPLPPKSTAGNHGSAGHTSKKRAPMVFSND